jgi:hypothetical protein
MSGSGPPPPRPEFTQLAEVLRNYLDEATERIIREEVFRDPGDPEA